MVIKGNLVDIFNRRIYSAEIVFDNGVITRIDPVEGVFQNFILPGFVDSHIHIESSMSIPSMLSPVLSGHGTIAAVCDPHEIANVCGVEGIDFMINDASTSDFKYFFGVPSCVPAASVDASGAVIDASVVEELISRDDLYFLAEMMNYPGVVFDDVDVHKKLSLAKQHNKPIDGHAPGLTGSDLVKYISSGVSTDHECATIEEAREKIKLGMKVLIREGSAARNFDNLLPLISEYPDSVMFCTDDAHPDFIEKRHIDYLVKAAIERGYDLFDVLKAACVNPVLHYSLPVGLLRVGDPADFIVVDSLENVNILQTVSNGVQVFPLFEDKKTATLKDIPNNFNAEPIVIDDLKVKSLGKKVKLIEILDGELWTNAVVVDNWSDSTFVSQSINNDYLKLAVLNRYSKQLPSIAFVKGFGLKKLAIATSIAHDSHNVICVGTHDELMVIAINEVVKSKGGIAVTDGFATLVLPLDVAGLMYSGSFNELLDRYRSIEQFIALSKSSIKAPLMTLSFLSLVVIPELKLASKGLFDVNSFQYTSLFTE
jgi:adenine deaminase